MADRSDRVATWLAATRRRQGRPGHPDARQPGRAVGVDAGGRQARRRHHADHRRARPRRPRRPHRPRRRASSSSPTPPTPPSSTTSHGDYTRIAVGEPRRRLALLRRRRTTSTSAGPFAARTDVDDSMLIYFTSGTTSKPKLVEHSQISYPVGHMSTMAWIGVRPGDVHLAISSPGWAKHAWSCFFAPWIAEATIFVYNYSAVRRRGAARPDPPRRRSTRSARHRRCGAC